MPPIIKFNKNPVAIVRTLVNNDYETYIVGGAVRDMLLHRQPKDYDIATMATPEEVRKVFGRRHCHIIGRRFRLALVFYGGETYEVSTFRRAPRPSRKNGNNGIIWDDNQFGTLEDDVRRRDFTVNALYYDVAAKGKIIDMTSGLDDLRERVVRCIGEPCTRFMEDPVRMLRALKLVGQNGFTLQHDVRTAIDTNAAHIRLASPARLLEEILKILFTGKALPILEACHQHGLLTYLWHALDAEWDTPGGAVIRELLHQRDRCLAEDDDYFSSKALAMGTVALPFMLSAIAAGGDETHWRHTATTVEQCREALRNFFAEYMIPNELAHQIIGAVLLLPSLAYNGPSPAALRSPHYQTTYELFRLLTMASGWMSNAFAGLPTPLELNQSQYEEEQDDTAIPLAPPLTRRTYRRRRQISAKQQNDATSQQSS